LYIFCGIVVSVLNNSIFNCYRITNTILGKAHEYIKIKNIKNFFFIN
jgi:hypothetical protein